MSAAAILVGAKELIRDPEHWCKCLSAANAGGQWVSVHSSRACSWCALGALRVACVGERRGSRSDATTALEEAAFERGKDVVSFNDTGTHREVMAMFNRAIEIARDAEA